MNAARAPLDADGLYVRAGVAYLVCPRLLAADARWGQHPSRHPAAWKRATIPQRDLTGALVLDARGAVLQVVNPEYLASLDEHTVSSFHYWPGHRPPGPGELAACLCGETLVWADGDKL